MQDLKLTGDLGHLAGLSEAEVSFLAFVMCRLLPNQLNSHIIVKD